MKKYLLFYACLFLCHGNIFAQDISEQEANILKYRFIEMYNDFLSYLPEISAKSSRPLEERKLAQKYIEQALNLFVNKGLDYQYHDEHGEKRIHKGACVNIISCDSLSAKQQQPIRPFLYRLMAVKEKYNFYNYIDSDSLILGQTRCMPDSSLYSIMDNKGTVLGYVVGYKIVETPEGIDSFFVAKISDITLIRE